MLFTQYLSALSEDVGIYQHSIYGIMDLEKGYTTDDNSRALILAVMLFERFHQQKQMKLIYKYLSFMIYAQNDNGRFKNFMSFQRTFHEEEGSEDCMGRCIWSLGYTIASPSIPENIKRSCWHMINKILEHWIDLQSPRAKAYSIVGLSYISENPKAFRLIEELSSSLVDQYSRYKDGTWHWFEESLTYGNSFFPWSMLRAYQVLDQSIFFATGKESMDFLESITLQEAFFKPIGCNGWLIKGSKPAEYDEQPIEACEMLLCYLEFYKLTKEKKYLEYAEKCFRWYHGCNSKGTSLLDYDTGACYDGLNENGLNLNQGSESLISYGIAYMEISSLTENVSIYKM
jgi:hypothetical protein